MKFLHTPRVPHRKADVRFLSGSLFLALASPQTRVHWRRTEFATPSNAHTAKDRPNPPGGSSRRRRAACSCRPEGVR